MPRPLYFLTHQGDAQTFSGYGIPLERLNEGDKSRLPGEWDKDKSLLVGMMLAEGTEPSTQEYIRSLKEAFGDVGGTKWGQAIIIKYLTGVRQFYG